MAALVERLRQAVGPHYEVQHELASGGMGSVFLARDTRLDRPVAIKVLRPELASATASERFLREARALARLKHPNIVPIYTSGESDGLSYYVMELIDGETLAERIASGPLAPDTARRLADDLLSALEAAHTNGIVHRDVKPANIFLVGDRAVLVDFGIVKDVEGSQEPLTAADHVVGTPAYMAPEQLGGAEAFPATDVYGAAMVLYEVFTGRKWLRQAPTADVDWTGVPKPLVAPLSKALAISPEDRWVNAAEFRRALEAAPGRATWRPLSRRAILATAVVAAIAASAVLAVNFLGLGAGPELIREKVAVAVFENQTGDPGLDRLGRMTSSWITEGLVEMRLATGLLSVVSASEVFYASQASSESKGGEASTVSIAGLAAKTRAGTIVSGAYFLLGDTLRFQAEVIDAATSEVLRSVTAAVGSPGEPMQAVNELRDRIQAALATLFDLRIGAVAGVASQPPTFEAYQEYVTGIELIVQDRSDEAVPHLLRAYAADSSFTLPLFWALIAHDNEAERDSLFRVVAALDEVQLRPYDRQLRDVLLSFNRDDPQSDKIQKVERLLDLAPDPLFVGFFAVFEGVWNDRPLLALRTIALVDPELNYARGWTAVAAASSYHMLGRHREELEEARVVGRLYPHHRDALQLEVEALGALGWGDEVWALVEEAVDRSSEERRWAERLVEDGATELYAHGHREAALELLGRAIEWYQTRREVLNPERVTYLQMLGEPTPEQREMVAVRENYGRVLYMAGRLEEAKVVFRELQVPPLGEGGIYCWRKLARVAARQGDEPTAMKWSECLWDAERELITVDRELEQARIHAIFGRKDEAVRLLRLRAARIDPIGSEYMERHRDYDLDNLRGYPPFEELIAPKG